MGNVERKVAAHWKYKGVSNKVHKMSLMLGLNSVECCSKTKIRLSVSEF